jgi:hypothetical protein
MSYAPPNRPTTPVAHVHAASDITSGIIPISQLATGTPDGTQFIRDDGTLAVPPSAAGVSDADYGDITVSSAGSVWTIDAGVIGTSKLGDDITTAGKNLLDDANVTAQRTTLGLGPVALLTTVPLATLDGMNASELVGRGQGSGAGAPQAITLGSGLSMTGTVLSSSGGGGVSDGDKGDITVSSSGTAWTIDNNTVTYAKMQDASAGNVVLCRANSASGDYGEISLAASKLLGRGSTGDVAAITLGTNLSMSGATLNAAAGSLTSQMVSASGNTTLTTSNTWYNGVTAAQSTSGTYLVTGTITFNHTATTARTYQARIVNTEGGGGVYASTARYMPSVNPSSCSLSLSALVVVPALNTVTLALAGLSTAGSASDFIVAALPTNGQGNNATSLTIVKIA